MKDLGPKCNDFLNGFLIKPDLSFLAMIKKIVCCSPLFIWADKGRVNWIKSPRNYNRISSLCNIHAKNEKFG